MQVPCGSLAPLEASQPALLAGSRCLLLAGYDGSRLPVAVVPLPEPGEEWPQVVTPIFDVPLKLPPKALVLSIEPKARPKSRGRHVGSEALRLWALAKELYGWDLLAGRRRGWLNTWQKQLRRLRTHHLKQHVKPCR